MLPYFIDSHCHLDFSKFNKDREEVIHRAKEAGACEMINSGVDLKTNFSTLELAKTRDCIYPTIGLSPMLATNPDKDRLLEVLSQLDEYASQAIGIGEAGMDCSSWRFIFGAAMVSGVAQNRQPPYISCLRSRT